MEGFEVASAADGESGLAAAKRLAPRVVLLDAMLPKKDGFSVCREIKSSPALSGVSVVMLTALGQETDRQRAAAAGADHFITKPFDENDLLALLRRLTADG